MKFNRFYRIWTIVTMAIRFFVQVLLFQRAVRYGVIQADIERRWETLVQRQAREFKETALHLEGLMIKMGQFLSTRADIMPHSFTHELSDLIDRVPAVPWEATRQILEREWNVPYGNVLQEISPEPIASASIGEVYRGKLYNGDTVAVKVKRHGIDRVIATDFRAVRIVSWLAKKFTRWGKVTDLDALNREMVETISKELDFRMERKHAQRFATMFEGDRDVRIPYYYDEYVTTSVLVMEWIDGAKVTDLHYMQCHNIDRNQVVQKLIHVTLKQMLQEGFFHADPHQGNIYLTADGTIVLLDFGMVGQIPRGAKIHVQQLIQAVVFRDYEKMVDALNGLRFIRKGVDRQEMAEALRVGLELYFNKSFASLDDSLLEEMMAEIRTFVEKQPIQLPAEYAFLGRAFSTIVGVISTIHPEVDFLEAGKPFVLEWIREEESEKSGKGAGRGDWIRGTLTDVGRDVLRTPRLLNAYLESPNRRIEAEHRFRTMEQWKTYYIHKQRMMLLLMLLLLTGGVILFATEWGSVTYGNLSAMLAVWSVLSVTPLIVYARVDREWRARLQSFERREERVRDDEPTSAS